jgi:hypothetical protein
VHKVEKAYTPAFSVEKQMASSSAKYMAALGQLEQFAGTTSPDSALLTHLLTGVRVQPVGDLRDDEDDSGLLRLSFPGGHQIEVIAQHYFGLMVAESVQFEQLIAIPEPVDPELSHSPTQKRIRQLREYLRSTHDLD